VETQLRKFAEAGYAAKTIQQTRSVLLRSIKRAQRDIKSLRNVAELAELPGDAPTRTSKSLARNEVDALLALKLTSWWRAYITVATHLGLRPGELLGLRWEDVDLDKGLMQVRYALRRSRVDGKYVRTLIELKTERSRRDLDMPAAVRRELTALRKAQIPDSRTTATRPPVGRCCRAGELRTGWPDVLRQVRTAPGP
jgi:integrase